MKSISLLPRTALIECLILLLLSVAVTLPFWLAPLDMMAAGHFYHPDMAENPWPEENFWLWNFFYEGAPLLAILLLVGSVAVLAFSGKAIQARLTRRKALFVLFSVMLGPGLVVNLVFKDHYGRPRPRQIESFQGHLAYQPPGLPGDEGKSFPCGHCSVGFVVWVFYFLNRRRRPVLATGLLLAAVMLGSLIGLGRMAAGAHFLSDVLWSGLLSYGVSALLYHGLVARWENRPADEIPEFCVMAYWQSLPSPARPWVMGGLAVLLILAGSVATPYKRQQRISLPDSASQHTLTITADAGDVVVRENDSTTREITATLSYKGFGFPTSYIDETYQSEQQTLHISTRGFFTDIEGRLEINLPTHPAVQLHVIAQKGRIFLKPDSGASWQLEAARGVVYEPALERRFGK